MANNRTVKSTILIVDDDPTGREVLRGILNREGYNVAQAANGAEALTKVARLIPDVILLDVMMPDIDGFEVCRRLRADPTLTDVPIIMLTALDDRASLLEGIEAGADDFITKPFDRVELRARLHTITRLNRFRRLITERSKFEWVVEQASDGYLVITHQGEIHYANQRARLYLNLPTNPGEPIAKRFQDLVREQFRCEPKTAWSKDNLLQTTTAENGSPRYLVRPETDTAQSFWLQVNILQINASFATTSADWVIHLHDVTSKMAMQREIWQFQAMISHKLRTPLIPILGGIDLVVSHIDKLSPEDIVQITHRAAKSAERLRNAIEDIVNYVNAPSLSPALQRGEFNLSQLHPMLLQLSKDLEITHLQVLDNPDDPAASITVSIAPQTMQAILREVLENSKKFHPQQTPAITVQISTAKIGASIKISDDGLTLSPKQLAQIWIPYYQGEKYFTGEVSGMGLGLPMVASLMWSINGNCRIYNRQPGPGVVVELDLPAHVTPTRGGK